MLVDDLIATGGTAFAAIKLLERAGAKVVGCLFVIDLPELGGADKIRALGKEVTTLVSFERPLRGKPTERERYFPNGTTLLSASWPMSARPR